MAVIKRIKSSQYAQIHNEPLQSLEDIRAIGVLSHLMSLPEDWEIHKTQLYKKFGRAAITHGLKELEEKGYFLSIQYRDGKMNYYMYYISDVPFTNEEVEEILTDLNSNVTNLISVSSQFEGILSSIKNETLSSVENRQLTDSSSQPTYTKEITTKKYKQRNKDLVNKEQVNNSNLEYDNQSSKIYEIEKQYMKQGLSKEVIARVKEEIESNRDKIDNYIGYYRSCLDNVLHKHNLKHGKVDMPYPHLGEGHPLNYDWLNE